jgi:DNA repair protein RecO (recombination protein O)
LKSLQTQAIVLSRTDYGEADRIITFLTPDQGKLRLMARGVRKAKSKVAGGVELFSTSDISFLRGKGEVGTLVSARLQKHYGSIERVQLGYELIKILNRATEDEPEPEYYELLENAFEALDNAEIPYDLIRLWFVSQLIRQGGHQPNLNSDSEGNKLEADKKYEFNFDQMAFKHPGSVNTDAIKFLRLLFSPNKPKILAQIQGSAELIEQLNPLVQTIASQYIRS